jgi:hypothetical protein
MFVVPPVLVGEQLVKMLTRPIGNHMTTRSQLMTREWRRHRVFPDFQFLDAVVDARGSLRRSSVQKIDAELAIFIRPLSLADKTPNARC